MAHKTNKQAEPLSLSGFYIKNVEPGHCGTGFGLFAFDYMCYKPCISFCYDCKILRVVVLGFKI